MHLVVTKMNEGFIEDIKAPIHKDEFVYLNVSTRLCFAVVWLSKVISLVLVTIIGR